MKIETIEFILVCVIVSIQVYVFTRTVLQIGIFKNIIPLRSFLKVTKISLPLIDLTTLEPKEILAKIAEYKSYSEKVQLTKIAPVVVEIENNIEEFFSNYKFEQKQNGIEKVEQVEIAIIECATHTNHVFKNILFSLNTYLIRNKGAASDFNLIKDIVERNADAVEEDINLTIAIPLYLGLMGTMIGIVIGLYNMSDLSETVNGTLSDENLGRGISILLGGVKIAMFASFVGLLLTILNSGWIFKGSRSLIETRKNEFYTFIQVELLPIINQGLGSTFESLQRNLLKFNSEFTVNLNRLSGVFDTNYETLSMHKELLQIIDRSKVSEMTKYNVSVLKELQVAVQHFEKFNQYFSNLNSYVSSSFELTDKVKDLLVRTDNFKSIADNLESRLAQSQVLLEFLSKHFEHLEEHKQHVSNTVAEVGHSISDTFKGLKEHIQNSSQAVKDFTVDEITALKTALSESRTNLGNLQFLESLNKDVSQFKNSSASQGERLKQQVEELNKNMAKSIDILENIEQSSKRKGFVKSFKGLFTFSKNKA